MDDWWNRVEWHSEEDMRAGNAIDFYSIRVAADRPLNDDQARQLFGCIGYAFRANFRGEELGMPVQIAPNVWVASYDITKSRSDDWLFRFDDALDDARLYAVEGSPPRKSTRTGPKGSRLVEGVGPIELSFDFA